ncbi:hypothetical protein KUW19_00185 [Ferrimonas balearica]|uniref:hypothetical protein n=1 Tax=Ferrimonas balearica TaxID=44012 RepID=UPI001C940115|nr:hypothetical protein [Ferrimonas balearica]MBY6104899.1 hypothetical protein [Ferrimonas balearica]
MALTADEYAELDWNRQMVAALRAALLGQVTDGAQSLQYNGRSIQRLTVTEQRQLMERCQREVERLNRKELGMSRTKTIRVIG